MPCPSLMSTRYRFRFWNLFYFNVLWYVWAWELILFVECRQGNEKQHTHARASPTLPWLHDHDTLTHALSAQCLCSKNLDRTGRVKEFRHVLAQNRILVCSLAAATSFVGQLVSLATRLMLDPPEPRTPRSQTLAQLFSTVHLQMNPQLSSCAYRDTVVAKVTQIPTTTFGEFQFTPN